MRTRLAWTMLAFLSLTIGLLLGPLVRPSPALAAQPLSAARSQALKLQAQIDALNAQMETAVERYDAARVELAQNGVQMAATTQQLALARYDLQVARHELTLEVVALYKRQPVQVLDVLLATRSFGELVDQVRTIGAVGQQSAGLVSQIDQHRASVAQHQAQLLIDRRRAQRLVGQAAVERKSIGAALGRRQRTLDHARANVKRLLAQMQARRELAATRAADAAQAATAHTPRTTGSASRTNAPQPSPSASASARPATHSSSPTPRARPTRSPTPGPRATPTPKPPRPAPKPPRPTPRPGTSAAVTIAKRYLGVPYVWGGASPAGFDCSGLVMYVFAQIGIPLPHNAAMQFAQCAPVSRGALASGDLVFFGSSAATIHHVGIYVGNGVMIDAPYTGAVVRYDALSSDFYSGGRPR